MSELTIAYRYRLSRDHAGWLTLRGFGRAGSGTCFQWAISKLYKKALVVSSDRAAQNPASFVLLLSRQIRIRTCAKLCHISGGELEQIPWSKFALEAYAPELLFIAD